MISYQLGKNNNPINGLCMSFKSWEFRKSQTETYLPLSKKAHMLYNRFKEPTLSNCPTQELK